MRTRSYAHVGSETPLIGSPIHAYLRAVAERHPDGDAVVSVPQGRRLSYERLFSAVDALAAGLMGLGIERGDRVGIWSTSNVEWVLLQIATARIGAVLVNVNPAYREQELEQALRAVRVKALFFERSFRSSDFATMVRHVCPESARCAPEDVRVPDLPDLRHLVVFDAGGPFERPAPGFWTWREVLARADSITPEALEARSERLDVDDPINIQFTSGTTGAPKPVVLTHHNILNNGASTGRLLGLGASHRLCVPVPLYHCFGMVLANLACFCHGAALVIPAPHFDAGATLAAVEAERCTVLHGVPTMFVDLLEHPDRPSRDLSSLRTGIMAGAPCAPELMRRVIEDLGCEDIRIGYGQTEASPLTHLTRGGDSFERRVETVGTNLPHQETKIVAPGSGEVLPLGAEGEICFRGYHVMRGYFERPDATREAIDASGWLHSGDLGSMDPEGYVRITGRLKDMIIRGGENIYPAEIEAYYYEHPKVAQVAVVGVPDERLGEEVAAWIQLHVGETAEAEELRQYAREGLAHFKVPRYLEIVEAFPMTVTGKIQKFRIRDEMKRRLALQPRRS